MTAPLLIPHQQHRSNRPCVFLDRDGVIVENRASYIRTSEDVQFVPGSVDAVRLLSATFDIVIVTNQSVIGRGIAPQQNVLDVHEGIVQHLNKSGARLVGTVVCPHTPTQSCECRKPAPGLITAAMQSWGCTLLGSWLIGDARTDVQAGEAVELNTVLVRTGRGRSQQAEVESKHPACVIVDTLASAAAWLLSRPGN